MPGDGQDIVYVLLDEFAAANKNTLTAEQTALLPQVKKLFAHYGHQCSMFGVWGSRTLEGHLYSARNLGVYAYMRR